MSTDPQRQESIDAARKSLERLQTFDSQSLPRVNELGTAINFVEAVAPSERLVDLYRQLSLDVLDQLPSAMIQRVQTQADNDFRILKSILDFEAGSPKQERDSRLQTLKEAYDPTFVQLHPMISYGIRKSTDFSRLEREARALIQNVTDKAGELQTELEKRKKEADAVLEAVRKVAEEQGVSQQAIYFKNEAESHASEAVTWLKTTIGLTVLLAIYAIATLFLHKWSVLAPGNTYETAQLAVSKVLVFVTISFFLILASRNFLAHRHNSVVNRHRQNALATYEALVKAAGHEASRDVVLAKAADCIFAAQHTGFGKAESTEGGNMSLVNLSPGSIKPSVS